MLLTVSEDAVGARLVGGGRPLLTEGIASWRRIAAERDPIYRALADVTVDTSRRPMTRSRPSSPSSCTRRSTTAGRTEHVSRKQHRQQEAQGDPFLLWWILPAVVL